MTWLFKNIKVPLPPYHKDTMACPSDGAFSVLVERVSEDCPLQDLSTWPHNCKEITQMHLFPSTPKRLTWNCKEIFQRERKSRLDLIEEGSKNFYVWAVKTEMEIRFQFCNHCTFHCCMKTRYLVLEDIYVQYFEM